MRYITNVYIKIKPLRMRYFLQLVQFIRKKGLEITIIKRKEENIQLSILMYHQSAHITLHFIKSVISKW